MSARAASVFLPTLRALERQLGLPLPRRLRLLEELAFDLEELEQRFVDEGMAPSDARARALEALVPDPATLATLDRLHAPMYRRLTSHLREARLRLLERVVLAVAGLGVLVAESALLFRTPLLADPSPFLWPTLFLGAVLAAGVLARGFGLWIRGDRDPRSAGNRGILVLAGLPLVAAAGGALVDLYVLAGTLELEPERATALTLQWLMRDATLLCVALLLALAGGLAWFVFAQWHAVVSGARRTLLGLERPAIPESTDGE